MAVSTSTSGDGDTLVVDQSFKNPVNGTGASIWTVSWNGPDGQLITFSESTDQPHQALTMPQAVALVTTPAWDKAWKALPAPCQFGAMIAPGATAAQLNSGTGFVCATSEAAAVHVPSIASAFTITSTTTTPIDARAVGEILVSCLGSDASAYHAVIAVRTPTSTKDWDGAVIAVNPAVQYVQCETKGHQGTGPDVPPTFINNRMWSPGHIIEFFDSMSGPAGQGQYLSLGAGHYRSDVAKITISYGNDPTQYPAIMAGGTFFYTAAISTGTTGSSSPVLAPNPHIHAYSASGQPLYNQ